MPRTFDSERVPRLLIADVRSTLGKELLPELLRVTATVWSLAMGLMEPDEDLIADDDADDGAYTIEEGQQYFDRKVVEDFQQYVHDMRIDTTWPACLRHRHHPMDYRQASDAWCCPRDDAPIVRLGDLASLTR